MLCDACDQKLANTGTHCLALSECQDAVCGIPVQDDQPMKRAKMAWVSQHKKMWESLPDFVGPKFSEQHDVGVMTERCKDCIDLALAHNADVNFIDVSQAAPRRAWSVGVRALVTGSTIFCVPMRRTLTATEHLELLGWFGPDVSTDSFGPTTLKNLSGEGMSIPSVTLVTICGLLSIEELWL